jgi:hypothetical protein
MRLDRAGFAGGGRRMQVAAHDVPRSRRCLVRERFVAPRHPVRQRGANAQPGGSAVRLGTVPSMARSPPPAVPPGIDASSPLVYGCAGERRIDRTGPCSTMRPAYITATRSAVSAMTPRSCVMSSRPIPNSCFISRSRSSICACTVTSSAVVGSSAMTSGGRQASATANMTRCRMPPESWCGKSSTRRSASTIRTARSRANGALPCLAAGGQAVDPERSAIWSPTRMTGLSAAIGSWKTKPMPAPRTVRMASSSSVARSRP